MKETSKKGLIETFMESGTNGFLLWFKGIVPAMILGYVIVSFLNLSGLMDVIGVVFGPVMGLFGLPGEAATAIVTAYMTLPAGTAMTAAMFDNGTLTAKQVTVLFPMMYCVASHLIYVGRLLGTSGVSTKRYPAYLIIGAICAIFSGGMLNLIL